MNVKIRDGLFFLMIATLIFGDIPLNLRVPFITGFYQGGLYGYPACVGLLYTVYCELKYHNIIPKLKIVFLFLCIYFLVHMIAAIHGMYIYPFYDDIFSGPYSQMRRLQSAISLCEQYNIPISKDSLFSAWVFIRPLKHVLIEVGFNWGIAYMIYCWYRKDWTRAIDLLCKGIIFGVSVLFLYSFILEIPFLAGNVWAKEVLEKINPYIHTIKVYMGWHPPLLWPNRVRSVFAEPSYLGYYIAIAIPVLIYGVFVGKKWKEYIGHIFLFSGLMILLFLSRARTGLALMIGEIIILGLLLLWLKKKELIYKYFVLVLCVGVAFVGANCFFVSLGQKTDVVAVNQAEQKPTQKPAEQKPTQKPAEQKPTQKPAEQKPAGQKNDVNIKDQVVAYIIHNISSINPTKKMRSNINRFATNLAMLKIAYEHPLVGVGPTLVDGYVSKLYTKDDIASSDEIKNTIKLQKEQGILSFTVPGKMGWPTRMAETGIIGFGIYIAPACYLLWAFLQNFHNKKVPIVNIEVYICFFLLFVGQLITGIASKVDSFLCFWITLGLGYAMCFETCDIEKNI